MPLPGYEEGVNSHDCHSSDSVEGVPLKKRMFLPGYEKGVDSHAWHSSDSVEGVPLKKRRFMPGYEEQGVNSHAWHSSDSVAGVPLKKRRSLLVRPQSPPPEIQSSPQLESHKEQLIAKPVSSSSNAGGFTQVSGFACSSAERPLPKKAEHSDGRGVNLVQNSLGYSDVNRHHQTLPNVFGSEVDSKPMLFPGNTELQLASYGHLIPGIKETVIKKEFSTNDQALSRNRGKSELLLIPKDSLRLATSGENSEAACKEQDKLDPYKWKLGLPKGHNCSNNNDLQSEINSTQRANRSHWDLNTTMETWEGSFNDAANAPKTGGIGVLDGAGTSDVKPAIGSREMVFGKPEGTHLSLGKEILHEGEHCSKPTPVEQQYRSDDLLRLGLRPLVPQPGFTQQLSIPKEVDSRRVTSNLKLPEVVPSPSKLVDHRIVKSEPSDEGTRLDLVTKVAPPILVQRGIVKSEPLLGCPEEPHKLSNFSHMKPVDLRAIKPEPVQGGSTQNPKRDEKLLMQSRMCIQNCGVPTSSDVPTSDKGMPVTNNVSQPLEFPTTELSSVGKVSGHSLVPITGKVPTSVEVGQGESISDGIVMSGLVSLFVSPDEKEENAADDMLDLPRSECMDAANTDQSRLNSTEEPHVDALGNGEASESDEKVKISADEEFSYDTESESDGNHATGDAVDKPHSNEDDYEDGEVREPSVHSATDDGLCAEGEPEHVGDMSIPVSGFPSDDPGTTSDVPGEDQKIEETKNTDCMEQCENSLDKKDDRGPNEVAFLQESSPIELPTSEVENKKPSEAVTSLDHPDGDHTDGDHINGNIVALASDTVITESEGPGTGNGKDEESSSQEDIHRTDSLGGGSLVLSKTEACVSGEEIAKDDNAKGNRSRIINLPRASNVSTSAGTGNGKDEGSSSQEDIHRTDSLGVGGLVLSKTEACINGEEITKDDNGKGNRSRIIHLPRASNVSTSAGTKPIQGRVLPSHIQGERFSDVVHRGDKLYARGSREGRYIDPRFERKRNRDQPFGSTGSEFRLGRGRTENRIRSIRGEWDSSVHDFPPEECNGPTGFRFPRSKNAASAKECSDFAIARGVRTMGTGRGRDGRKSLDDELSNFQHPPSRRRSPGGREGPVSRVRRAPRDINPDRCNTEDDPNLIGLRHEEKFMRGLQGEVMSTVFSRSQPQYERLDDSFVRGDTSFSPMQRRVPPHIPQVHSKSPPRSRTRSPGPWSSPRRRSPDGFVRHPELTHCRSPRIYRMERMRSPPQHPCFAEEMVVRRHDSPPYISRFCNDMREIGSSRENDHPRSFVRSRSPSGRILTRSTRRFEMVDPRERTESDELFAEAMHSGRFHGLVGDVAEDGRRKCIERRGPVRSFRPPYNDSDVVNFRHHEEDGPRPYRFCPEVDIGFHERGNARGRGFERGMRGRGFDRRMKN